MYKLWFEKIKLIEWLFETFKFKFLTFQEQNSKSMTLQKLQKLHSNSLTSQKSNSNLPTTREGIQTQNSNLILPYSQPNSWILLCFQILAMTNQSHIIINRLVLTYLKKR